MVKSSETRGASTLPPTPPDYPHRPALELTVFKAVPDLCQWQFLAEPCQAQIPPHARAWRRSIFWNCHSNMRPLNFLSCSACFFVRLGLVMIEKIAKSSKIYFPIHAPFILRGSWYLSSWRFPFVHRKQLLFEGHDDIPSLCVFSHDSFQKNIHLCILSNRHWENGETLCQCRQNDCFQLLTICIILPVLFLSVLKFIALTNSEISSSEISSGGTDRGIGHVRVVVGTHHCSLSVAFTTSPQASLFAIALLAF